MKAFPSEKSLCIRQMMLGDMYKLRTCIPGRAKVYLNCILLSKPVSRSVLKGHKLCKVEMEMFKSSTVVPHMMQKLAVTKGQKTRQHAVNWKSKR